MATRLKAQPHPMATCARCSVTRRSIRGGKIADGRQFARVLRETDLELVFELEHDFDHGE